MEYFPEKSPPEAGEAYHGPFMSKGAAYGDGYKHRGMIMCAYGSECWVHRWGEGRCKTPGRCVADFEAGDIGWHELHPACRKVGMDVIDEVSYVYVGSDSTKRDVARAPSRFRLMADNEFEGDEDFEVPDWLKRDKRIARTRTGARRGDEPNSQWNCGIRGCRVMIEPHDDNRPYYRYVGGLEKADNHGRDGVNVLYLDWHAEFDARAWPSPIGLLDMTRWTKLTWQHVEDYENSLGADLPEP
jgi:prepilin-type processing-associated H-X9-DG protein